MKTSKGGTRLERRTAPIHAFGAAVLGLLVMPIAFAGAANPPEAGSSASAKRQIQSLKRRSPEGPLAGGDGDLPANWQLVGGGFEWATDAAGTSIIYSSPTFVGDANVTWVVRGRATQNNTLHAEANCIAP